MCSDQYAYADTTRRRTHWEDRRPSSTSLQSRVVGSHLQFLDIVDVNLTNKFLHKIGVSRDVKRVGKAAFAGNGCRQIAESISK
jgi:hypothetical protein